MRPKKRAHRARLTPEQHSAILDRIAAGETQRIVAAKVGCSERSIRRLLSQPRRKRRTPNSRTLNRLSLCEREEIALSLVRGKSFRAIGRALGRAPSTISREVAANGGRHRYRAIRGELSSKKRHLRPRLTKLESTPELRRFVEMSLEKRWSPQQISAQLVRDFPTDKAMRISHETIYASLFIQTRGVLRRELTRYLRSGRARRRPQTRLKHQGRIPNMVMISDRPPEAEDRAVPGHWEGDLIIGRGGKSAIATLVERRSRYVILARLPHGRGAEQVRTAIAREVLQLPHGLRKSLTWDQGKEMADHIQLKLETAMDVYFCDPHSPWQRGSNENTNGLLRQYFPKATNLADHSQAHLDHVARELNGRPRQTLGWLKPYEVFNVVASTG